MLTGAFIAVSFNTVLTTTQELLDGFKLVKSEVEYMERIGYSPSGDAFLLVMKVRRISYILNYAHDKSAGLSGPR